MNLLTMFECNLLRAFKLLLFGDKSHYFFEVLKLSALFIMLSFFEFQFIRFIFLNYEFKYPFSLLWSYLSFLLLMSLLVLGFRSSDTASSSTSSSSSLLSSSYSTFSTSLFSKGLIYKFIIPFGIIQVLSLITLLQACKVTTLSSYTVSICFTVLFSFVLSIFFRIYDFSWEIFFSVLVITIAQLIIGASSSKHEFSDSFYIVNVIIGSLFTQASATMYQIILQKRKYSYIPAEVYKLTIMQLMASSLFVSWICVSVIFLLTEFNDFRQSDFMKSMKSFIEMVAVLFLGSVLTGGRIYCTLKFLQIGSNISLSYVSILENFITIHFISVGIEMISITFSMGVLLLFIGLFIYMRRSLYDVVISSSSSNGYEDKDFLDIYQFKRDLNKYIDNSNKGKKEKIDGYFPESDFGIDEEYFNDEAKEITLNPSLSSSLVSTGADKDNRKRANQYNYNDEEGQGQVRGIEESRNDDDNEEDETQRLLHGDKL